MVDVDADMSSTTIDDQSTTSSTTSSKTRPFSNVLIWALPLALGFGLWAFSSPVGANPDEPVHVMYAWSIATGQGFGDAEIPCSTGVRPCPRANTELPDGLVPSPGCYAFKPEVPAACETTVAEGTHARYLLRYPPLYYAAIGATLRIALAIGIDGPTAVDLGRLVSVMISITLLAPALALAWARARGLVPALVVLLTPMTLFMVGAINPTGAEITAAMAVATALVVLAESTRHRAAQALLVYGSVWLVWSRPLGFVWAGAITLFGLAYIAVSDRTGRPLRSLFGDLTTALAVAAANLVGGVLWFLYANSIRAGSSAEDSNTLPEPGVESWMAIALRWGGMLWENLGVLGWLDTTLPFALMLVSAAALAVVVWEPTLSPDTDTIRRRIAAFYMGCIVLGASLLMVYQEFLWQGRYVMPALAAGYLLLVGTLPHAAPRRMFGVAAITWIVGVIGAVWFYARHVYGIQEGVRYSVPNFSDGAQWFGPLGNVGYLVAALLAAASLPAAFVVMRRREATLSRAE